jgi:hypothetical protein
MDFGVRPKTFRIEWLKWVESGYPASSAIVARFAFCVTKYSTLLARCQVRKLRNGIPTYCSTFDSTPAGNIGPVTEGR